MRLSLALLRCTAPPYCTQPASHATVLPLKPGVLVGTIAPSAPLRHCVIASLHHCITAPLRHWAIGPLRQCAIAPLRHCVTAQLRNCVTASLRHKSRMPPCSYVASPPKSCLRRFAPHARKCSSALYTMKNILQSSPQ